MPFEIQHQPFGSLTEYFLHNPDTGEYASILPAYGAIVRQLVLQKPAPNPENRLVSLIRAPKSEQALLADETHASALLFPFPSRIRHGIYGFQGEMFTLPMNEANQDNAIHGFLADKPFELLGQTVTDTGVSLALGYVHDGSYPGYPFPFEFRVRYSLSTTGFSVQYEVLNTSQKPAPVSFGWHPYFTLNEEPVDQLTIQIPAARQIVLDDNLLPAGETLFTEHGEITLRERELDAAFLVKETTEGGVTTVLRSAKQGFQLNVWQETGPKKFNYLVVYTPPVGRNNIAIEALTSNVNAFNNGEGLIILAPNEIAGGTIRVFLS